MDEQQNGNVNGTLPPVDKDTMWVLDNYILLKDYLDRTVSRIAARCIRKGNIAIEEYPFYNYILDVLEEISESGDFILAHSELYPYVEKKIAGGMAAFKKNLNDYKVELRNNSTPDMIKQDTAQELEKMKEALGSVDKSQDPTVGAGMSMDEVIEKLMEKQHIVADEDTTYAPFLDTASAPKPQPEQNLQNKVSQPQPAPRPQPQATVSQPQPAPRPQPQAAVSQPQPAPRPQPQNIAPDAPSGIAPHKVEE